MNWPLVVPNDDGIRPAGKPDQCLYCKSRIGEPHARDCVVVTKLIELRATVNGIDGTWRQTVPHAWDEEAILYRYNDSTWCAGNLFEEEVTGPLAEHLGGLDSESCLCDVTTVALVRVVDDTPTRTVR